MKKTIVDVANYAHVSTATVSRVINNNSSVNENTRNKVLQAIDALNFIPNLSAKEVKKKLSTTIGIIVPSVENNYFSDVIKGIEKGLENSGYTVLIAFSKGVLEKEKKCVYDLMCRNVAGIIVVDAKICSDEKYLANVATAPEIVCINGDQKNRKFSYVCSRESEGCYNALKYLYDSGFNNIKFIRGSNSYSYDIKEQEYLKFAKKYNLNPSIINIGDGNSNVVLNNTEQQIAKMVNWDEKVGFVTCNDLMAISVMNYAKKMNKKIPEDISIIGFDNTLICSMVTPNLSSVDQHMQTLGEKAIELLLKKIANPKDISENIYIDTNLVIRKSTY